MVQTKTTINHKNIKLLILALLVVAVSSIATILFKDSINTTYKPGASKKNDVAVNQAQIVFEANKQSGVDMSSGPCLTNALLPDWVLDIAHNPRQVIDDLPENQCQSFVEGKSKHFVEMDANGNVLRVR